MLGLEIATQMHSHQNPTPLKVENQVVLQDELPEIVALLHLKVRNIVRAGYCIKITSTSTGKWSDGYLPW